jgi:hypothetical protein
MNCVLFLDLASEFESVFYVLYVRCLILVPVLALELKTQLSRPLRGREVSYPERSVRVLQACRPV